MSRKNTELAIAMGQRMAEKRKACGLTQEMVAETAGISHQQYNKIENGKACLSSATLKQVCDALHTSADYLLYGERDADIYAELYVLMKQLSDEKIKIALKMVRYVAESDE